jgi:hypothetical protein
MYRRMLSQLLALALLVTILVLALSACGGGGQEKAKARPLPLYETAKALRPGEYHSVKFKPPLSFKVGKGWWHVAAQLSDYIELGEGEIGLGHLHFANVKEVFKPGTTNVVEAPKDLVGWLQHHPYLENLQTTAGHPRRSQGRADRRARRSLAQGPQRVLWLGLLGHL